MPGLPTTVNLLTFPAGLGATATGYDQFDFTGSSMTAAGDINGDGINDWVIGARGRDGVNGSNTGAVYVVFGVEGGLPPSISLGGLDGTNGFRVEGFDPGDYAGYWVTAGGDVNGDGIDDLVIGAPGVDDTGAEAGGIYVLYGKTDPFDALIIAADLTGPDGAGIDGVVAGDRLGRAIAMGDINGDGLADLVVGSLFSDAYAAEAGTVWVVFGVDGGLPADIDLNALDGTDGFRLDGAGAGNRFGGSVAVGDVNGDDIADIIVGASSSYSYGGAAFVIFGKEDPFDAALNMQFLDGTNGYRIDPESTGDRLGSSVAFLGDVNGDGDGDFVLGAVGVDSGGFYTGAAYVVFGGASPGVSFNVSALNGANGFQIDGSTTYDAVGLHVARAGDINGDGFDDIAMGSFRARPGGYNYVGTAWLVFGGDDFDGNMSVSELAGGAGMILVGGASGINAGEAVGGGDIDGDGVDDLIVSATGVYTSTGRAYVIYGRVDGATGAGGGSLTGGNHDDELTGAGGVDVLTGGGGDDAIDAGGGNDELYGGEGVDDLIGGGGHDYLNGGAGADEMVGGVGDDTYYIDDAGDVTTEVGGQGADVVRATITVAPLADNIETLILEGVGNINGAGNTGNNNLNGNVGNNILNGGDGNDLIKGGDGDDTLNGDAGADQLLGGTGTDTLNGLDQNDRLEGGDGNDTILGGTGADILDGGIDNDTLTGGTGADQLLGGAGTDTLDGGSENDVLDGGAGADAMTGGAGDDIFYVNDAGDTVTEALNEGTDTVRAVITVTLAANVERLILEGIAGIGGTGNTLANVMTGNAGANTLNGGDGADLINGGLGADTLNGDAGADNLTGGDGDDVLDGGADGDTLSGGIGTDSLTGGTGNDNLDGGANDDSLVGGAGADTLNGSDGVDTLDGGADNDVLNGGAGADAMTGGTGDDTFHVGDAGDTTVEALGEGTDTVRASVNWTLGANIERIILEGVGNLNGTGNGLANIMTGNGGNNVLDGGAGADNINGLDGDDRILGGAGDDFLRGGLGMDVFAVAHAFAGGLETDQVSDFSAGEGDIVDLSAVDAIAGGADDAFTLVGAFSGAAGQMTLSAASGVTSLRLDVNGDGAADYLMRINGDVTGEVGDWVL